MSLPPGVKIARRGRREFVTQRGYFTPPYCDCMFAALASILIYTGYRLPLPRRKEDTPPENFLRTLRRAAGAMNRCGTSTGDSQRALRALLPDAPIYFGRLTDVEVRQHLRARWALRVTIPRGGMKLLPEAIRKPYSVGHAVAIVGYDRGWVLWMDPMGRPSEGYDGVWVRLVDILPHLNRGKVDGKVIATLGKKHSATKKANP